MGATLAVARRELAGYFATPVAYVFIVIFLVLSGALTFTLGAFFSRGQADLQPFFNFVPWLFLFLVPALTMRLWAEERRLGTIELLLTLPLAQWQAVVGKMDALVKQYAEILRDDPGNAEAAFNYEYLVRLRQVIAARKSPVAPFDAMDQGLTIHGFAGAPPEESDMKKFKMIVPMRPDERLEAEKAGKGTTKVKKG